MCVAYHLNKSTPSHLTVFLIQSVNQPAKSDESTSDLGEICKKKSPLLLLDTI